MTRRRAGWTLHLTMVAIAAVGALFLVVSARMDAAVERRNAEDVRVQARWLARSAARTRRAASHRVVLPRGDVASVRVFAFGSGRFAADVVVADHGTARADATFATDGRITALREEWIATPRTR